MPQPHAAKSDAPPPRPVNLLLYAPSGGAGTTLGQAEYSYGFAAKAYRQLFETLAPVREIKGAPEAIDEIHAELIARGEGCIVLSFFPPHRTSLALRAPVVPMIAWEYPTIPDASWNGELNDDWRFVLRQAGRVVVASHHSATAIRAAMGAAFPVVVIPHPVFDRGADPGLPPQPGTTTDIALDGFVFDSRIDGVEWLGRGSEKSTGRSSTVLDGIVITAVLAPKDGRKAWQDTVTAFVDAHRDHADATLVLKMITDDPGQWRWELHEILSGERPFLCRVVVLHGYLDEASYAGLVAASHWIVSATLAEGQCLPLLEFMSAGRPAITAAHTAMADYATPGNALLIDYDEERCAWPQDSSNRYRTTRAQLDWGSLRDALKTAYELVLHDRPKFLAMGRNARETMRGYCSDAVVAERLDSFLGLNLGMAARPAPPSSLADSLDTAA